MASIFSRLFISDSWKKSVSRHSDVVSRFRPCVAIVLFALGLSDDLSAQPALTVLMISDPRRYFGGIGSLTGVLSGICVIVKFGSTGTTVPADSQR
jgi:hypothetical protein